MPRVLRTSLPDGFFHVTARGVDGAAIVRDPSDCRLYVHLLALTIARHHWECHAYCLMPNHVHAVVDATQQDLSAGVQYLHGTYALAFNRRHRRTGHLFGARFASWIVETERHLVNACRYVYLNPVRAGLCARPEDWPWSGIRA
ncbi:MAG TPA: transposase [Gaiellaceae bacterium]|nr:transposase [Gaiellaceae bacterium]